ncbi:hypothetical protein SteCoe_16403 [Stentor coeruleus]|uniref:Uncharacterized protein n=1 Tax=Stentor coeruleus TaxID=5963 RepID=A0A1R2C1F0_9CILI|nr:hypothetical protein SteCoe_16403 [Stentor coeruleus]
MQYNIERLKKDIQVQNYNPINNFDSDKIIIPKLEKNPECLFLQNTGNISVLNKSLSLIKSSQSENIHSLQLENPLLKAKAQNLTKGQNSNINSRQSQELLENILKTFKTDILCELDQHLSLFSSTLFIKIINLSNKLQNAINSIKTFKQKLQKSSELLEKSYSKTILETQNLIKSLKTELKQSKNEIISPIVTIYIQDLELNPKSNNLDPYFNQELLQKNYQNLILTNIQLKADILNNEGELSSLKNLEENHKKLQEKYDFLEKINKELSSQKADSDNSLNLDCSNLKEIIEIQELRSALRIISEKYEQEKEIILKDCAESRQDIETQMFRLQNEKTYIEVKLKDTEKILTDVNREKERLEGTVVLLKKEIERFRDCKNQDGTPKGKFSKYTMEFVQISNSEDFELTESVDKFAAVNSNDLYEMLLDDINVMALKIKSNLLVDMENIENKSSKDVIMDFIDIGMKIKGVINNDSIQGIDIKNLAEGINDVLNKYKVKISILEEEKTEKDRKIEAFEKIDVMDELYPRMSTPGIVLDSGCYMKRQLQIEKTRVFEKKHAIQLYKEQIACLKQNVRDLQMELDKVYEIDIGQARKFWWSFGKEIPWLQEKGEGMMEAFCNLLGFDGKEYQVMKNERKSKRSKKRFGFFR